LEVFVMKKLWIAFMVLAFAASSIPASAGQHGNRQGGQMDAERRAKMQERLGLTEEQMSRMRDIRNNGGSREDMRAVLTDEQRSMIEEHRRNREARGDHEGRNRPPARHAAPESSSDG
jgi:Spy/CpxP family protein refolding chaperone